MVLAKCLNWLFGNKLIISFIGTIANTSTLVAIIMNFRFQILLILVCLASCKQGTQSSTINLNDDSLFVLAKQIDSIKHTDQVFEKEYTILYGLADRVKPYCDNFQGSDKSKLPEIYNFCAEMYRRRCYVNNGQQSTIKGCQYTDRLIDCCLKAIPISKSLQDTLSLNYTNSLCFLAEAYEQLGKIEEALKLRLEILSKYQKMYPEEMSDMPMYAIYDVGKVYELKGEFKNANEYFKKVLRFQKAFDSKFLTETVDSIKQFQLHYKDLLK